MAGVVWLEGENGAVLTLPAPLPPAVQRRVDDGLMRVVPGPEREPEAVLEAGEPEDVPMPSNGASRADWEAYAVAHGLSAERAEGMTRNQLSAAMRLRAVS